MMQPKVIHKKKKAVNGLTMGKNIAKALKGIEDYDEENRKEPETAAEKAASQRRKNK